MMKNTLFLMLLLLSTGLIQAQEKLSKEEKERREKNIQAGNPFAKFGSKAPVATLSKGKYLEVHDLDSIVTIGTIRWHVENQQIVGRLIRDTTDPDAQPVGDVAGRWMSLDPLSEEFPSWSPYNFVMNNPINMIDPDGRAPDWHKDGKGNLIADKGDNAKTLRQYVNENYKDANLSKSASNTLYSTLKNNKINIDRLNPETLNKNIFGLNYPGANNPKKYNGESDYSVKPTEIEVPAFVHDKDYDDIKAVGGGALFFNSATTTADNNFVNSMDKLVEKYKDAGEYKSMFKAATLRDGLDAASSFKQSWQQIKESLVVPSSITNPTYLHP